MSMPEENKPDTGDTDQVLPNAEPERRDGRTEMAAALEDALSETGMDREDLTGER